MSRGTGTMPGANARPWTLLIAAAAATLAFYADPDLSRATFPGTNGKIAFTGQTGSGDVFTANPDGSGTVNLTNDPESDSQGAWSPDGSKIAFTSSREWGIFGNDIWVMNADGTGLKRLTTNGVSEDPAWSPDGTKIAFSSTSESPAPDIFVMNADGTGVANLGKTTDFETQPDWSPDGKTIAYTFNGGGPSGRNIYVMDSDGKNVKALVTATGSDSQPVWAPSGGEIAFVSERGGTAQIWKVKTNGSDEAAVTVDSTPHMDPVWSPDGTRIAFSGAGAHTAKPDGTDVQPLAIGGAPSGWQPLVSGKLPPVASFGASRSTAVNGQTVQLISTSTGGSGTLTGQSWDLDGDGAYDDALGASAEIAFASLGDHEVRLAVTSSLGLTAAYGLRIEVIARPETTIDSAPTGTTASETPVFTFSSPDPTATGFECRMDGAGFAPCASPLTPPALADGAHTFEVRAVQAEGFPDETPASTSFVVDAPPQTIVLSGPGGTTSSTSATFGFQSNQPGTFVCSLDGAAPAPCGSPWTYNGLANGSHSFTVTAIDSTGNADPTPATAFWAVDSVAPGFNLLAAKTQFLTKARTVTAKVTCLAEPCAIAAAGTVQIQAKKLKLTGTTATLQPNQSANLKLRLPAKVAKQVGAALDGGKKPIAKIAVTATDAVGNRAELNASVKLRQPS